MKININTNEFLAALKFTSNLIQLNSSNNVFNSVLIDVTDNEINIIGTNGNISSCYTIKNGFTIKEKGRVLVKGKLILNIISKLKDLEIRIELIDNFLRILTDNYESNINILEAEIFPHIDFDVTNWKKLKINNETFSGGIKKVQKSSIFHSEKINKLNGIYIDSKTEKTWLKFIATDSYKLSMKKFKIDDIPEVQILARSNVLSQIANYLKLNEEVNIYVKDNDLIIKSSDFMLRCSTIDSDFPDITSLLIIEKNYSFKVSLKDLSNALDKIIALTNTDKNYTAALKLNHNSIELECKNVEFGNSKEKINVTDVKGNGFKVSFNASYLLDLLQNFDNNLITFIFSDESRSFLIIDEKEPTFIQLLIPLTSF